MIGSQILCSQIERQPVTSCSILANAGDSYCQNESERQVRGVFSLSLVQFI